MKSHWLFFVLCTVVATAAQGVFEGREITRRPDMCNVDMVDTVSWYAEESVRLTVEPWRCGKRVEIPQGSTAAWVVTDEGGTNWIVRYDAAPASNRCAFALAAGEGHLPEGHDYTGYVSLMSGTNILGVLDRHEVVVLDQAADGGGEISPEGGVWGSLLARMAKAEADIHGIAGDLATNAAEIAELEERTSDAGWREWLRTRGIQLSLAVSEGLSTLKGFDHYLSFEEGIWELWNAPFEIRSTGTNSTWNFRLPSRPMWNGAGLATTNDLTPLHTATNSLNGSVSALQSASNALHGAVANLNAATNSLQGRAAAAEAVVSELRLATNALFRGVAGNAADIDELEAWRGGVYAQCRGGYRWPDWFRVARVVAGVAGSATTNETAAGSVTAYNVAETVYVRQTLKGWEIDTEIVRRSAENSKIAWTATDVVLKNGGPQGRTPIPPIDPADLSVEGNRVFFAAGAAAPQGNAYASMVGRLGNMEVRMALDWDGAKQSSASTVARFSGPAPGTLLAACWTNVLGAASNGWSQGKDVHLRTWPEGYGSSTDRVSAGWNPNFWGAGLGDFSCVSYHTDTPGGGVYKPLAMVTDRHAVCANHWKPAVGSNVYWVSRSGAILTNRVVAYQNIRGDLTVARLEHPFATNDILPATLLAPGFWHCTYGTTNATHGMPGFPCISFDCAERGYLSGWEPLSLAQGRTGKDLSQDGYSVDGLLSYTGEPWTAPYVRAQAIGGDSGSPTFWPAPGCTVLLGCFHVATGGPMPRKDEIDEAIEAWGDAERCTEWDPYSDGRWANPDVPPGM